MQPRIKSPVFTLAGSREALLGISKSVESCGVPRAILELVNLRIGQIHGCSVCVDMHCRALKKLGESDHRIFNVGAWREAPYYSEPERAALALAEAATRLCDRCDAVPDDIWHEATRHFSEPELSGLVMAIALSNLWNRLNVPTRQVSGEWIEKYI